MRTTKYELLRQVTLGLSALLFFGLTNPIVAQSDVLPAGKPFQILQQMITENRAAIADLTLVTDSLKTDLAALNLEVTAVTARVAASESAMDGLKLQIENTTSALDGALRQIAANTAKIAQLEKDAAANAAEIEGLKSANQALQQQVTDNKTELSALITQLRTDYNTAASELSALQVQVTENNASVQSQIAAIQDKIAVLQPMIEDANATIPQLLAALTTITRLNSDVNSLLSRMQTAEIGLNNLRSNFYTHRHFLFANNIITWIEVNWAGAVTGYGGYSNPTVLTPVWLP